MYMVIKSFTASIIWGVVGICVFHTYLYNMKHCISMLICTCTCTLLHTCTCNNYVVKINLITPDVHVHVHRPCMSVLMCTCTCNNYVGNSKPYYTHTPHVHVHVIIIL